MKKIMTIVLKVLLLLVMAPLLIANQAMSSAFGIYGSLSDVIKGEK